MNLQDLYSQLASKGYNLFGVDGTMFTNPGMLQQYLDQGGDISGIQALGGAGDVGPSGTYGRDVAQLSGANGDYSMATPDFRQIEQRDPGWFNTTGMPLIGAGMAAYGLGSALATPAADTSTAALADGTASQGAVDAGLNGAAMDAGGAAATDAGADAMSEEALRNQAFGDPTGNSWNLSGGTSFLDKAGNNPATYLTGAALASSLLNRPQTPSSPDYTALANQQQQQQQQLLNQQTQANRYNQVTPYGNMTWTQDANGNWTQTQTLSPGQQKILDQQTALSGDLYDSQKNMLNQVNSQYSQPFSGGDPAARDQTIASQYNAMTSRLNPQWDQRQKSFTQQMANQGLTPGTEAYDNAFRDLSYAQNDAYQQAQNQALQLGNQEFQNSYSRNLETYKLPMNMLNALRTGSQVQNPTYTNQNTSANAAQPANLTQAAQNQYNANLNTTNANNAYNNNLTTGLFGLAGTSLYGNRY